MCKLGIPLVLVAVMWLSGCDQGQETLPTAPATNPAGFDVSVEGIVTSTFSLKATCQKGVTGYVTVFYAPSGQPSVNEYCSDGGGWEPTVDATGMTGFTVRFLSIQPAPAEDCGQVFYSVSGGDIPVRTKCTVNGRDVGGKPLAKMEIKYVK